MSNKKVGCLRCRHKAKATKIFLNFRPFLRAIKEYRESSIDRATFIHKYGNLQKECNCFSFEEKEYKK